MQKSSENTYNPDSILDMNVDFLSIECLDKLGLEQNPFIDHARDPFLFIDQQLEMSVNVLVDYLQNQNSTLVLVGEIGVGKTTLLRILLRQGYQHFNFCTLRAKTNITFSHIEERLKERWRITGDDTDKIVDTDEYIKKYIETDKYPVIIIDDAHRLRTHELDALLQLKHRVGLQSKQALGLVLATEPSIQSKLSELEKTNPAASHIYQINARPFDAKQCQNYVNFRLKKAGAIGKDLFNQEQLQEIFNKSKGLPRIINSLAREMLHDQCEQKTKHLSQSQRLSLTPGMRLGLILVSLLIIALLIGIFSNNPNKSVELEIAKPEVKQDQVKDETKTPKVDNSTITKPKNISKPYVAPLVLGPLQNEIQTTPKKQVILEKQTKQAEAKPKKQTALEKQTKAEKVAENEYPLAPDWLLKQDSNSYTIQIVASPSQENLFAFTKKNLPDHQTAYYIKNNQEKQWYILVYGVFTNREQALNAIEKLPAEIKKNKPYPLQIDKIHTVIRN